MKKLGRCDEAVSDLTASISLDGNDWLAYAHRGDCYAALGAQELAVADLEKSARYASPSGPVLNRNAYKYLAMGMPERALYSIDRALRRDPENPSHLDTAGDVLCKLGRHEEARMAYVAAFVIDPAKTTLKFRQLGRAGYDLLPPEKLAAKELIEAFSEWFLDGCPGVVADNLPRWTWIADET